MFYDQPFEFYSHSYNPEKDKEPRCPIYFLPENKEFPPHHNTYVSNCVEFWKYITDKEVPFVDENRYMVSSAGNTWDNLTQNRISCNCSQGNGFYVQANIHTSKGQTTVKLHRLVMMLFDPIEDPKHYQVNHKDTIHHHNDLSNLEWCTDAYNRYHGILNDAGSNIFDQQIIILFPFEIKKIRELREKGLTYVEIAEEMNKIQDKGIHKALVARIITGKSQMYSQYY